MAETLFISDLHLDAARPEVTQRLLDFLAEQASQAAALYILGDLFEAWLGDDDTCATNQRVIQALQQVTRRGVPSFFVHGNRDFLIGEAFADRTGCRLLPESSVVDLHGTPTLLMHGDTLCTDDVRYQAFRRQVRTPAWQREFLSLPLAERAHRARQLREQNNQEKAAKPEAIMDVNQDAVEAAMRSHQVTRLIHGHTHRPAIHRFLLDGVPAQRMVLGTWETQGSVLRCSAAGCRLESC